MLLVLRRITSIEQTTKIFLASLTLNDLCTGLIWIPKLMELYAGFWLLGSFVCEVHHLVQYILNVHSFLFLLLLTVDRYIAISYPLQYPTLMTVFRVKVTLCVSLALGTVSCILLSLLDHKGDRVKSGSNYVCAYVPHELGVPVYLTLIPLVLIIATIFILYVRISLIARRHARRIAAENQAGNGQGGQAINTRSTTTIIIVTATLIITGFPTIIWFAIITSGKEIQNYDNFLAQSIADFMLLSNTWLNALIYYIRNRDLRLALHN